MIDHADAVIHSEGPWQGMTMQAVSDLSPEDYNRLMREFRVNHVQQQPSFATWMPVVHDPGIVTSILDGSVSMPRPSLVELGSGFLLYEGLVHSVAGESGAGKSLFALQCGIETMNTTFTGHVLWIDLEMNYTNTLLRLHELGYDIRDLSHFHYIRPTVASDNTAIDELVSKVEDWSGDPVLVVVDSVGEALNLAGKDSNTEEVSEWFRLVSRRLADAGASVLLIDHTAKNAGSGDFAIGSQRKRATVDVQFMLRQTDAFSRAVPGCSTVWVSKDRFGHYTRGTPVAKMAVDVQPTRILFEPIIGASINQDGSKRYTTMMQEISEFLAENPATRRQIRTLGGDEKNRVKALEQLVAEGFVGVVDTTATYPKYQNLKPFTVSADRVARLLVHMPDMLED